MKLKLSSYAKIILSGGLSIFLTASCAGPLMQCPKMPNLPVRPQAEMMFWTEDGWLVLSPQDAESLGLYIIELERGYE